MARNKWLNFFSTVSPAFLLVCNSLFALPPDVGPLTFADEFNGSALDNGKWMFRALGPRHDAVNTTNAISVTNGVLTLKTYSEDGTHYTGMVATAGRFEQTYGYFETRVRFHTASGQWNTFWVQSTTIGDPAGRPEKAGVEMDIFEHRMHDPFDGLVSPTANILNRSHQALVWDGYGPQNKSKANLTPPLPGLTNDTWHTFGFSWTTNRYDFYYDDTIVWSETSPISHRSQYLILSSEVWQKFAGPIPVLGYGSRETSTTGMEVDYVRVYKNPASRTPAVLGTPKPVRE